MCQLPKGKKTCNIYSKLKQNKTNKKQCEVLMGRGRGRKEGKIKAVCLCVCLTEIPNNWVLETCEPLQALLKGAGMTGIQLRAKNVTKGRARVLYSC